MRKLLLAVLAATISTSAFADCQSAVNQVEYQISSYNSALAGLSSDLIDYGNCVAHSVAENECHGDFNDVESAQSQFESPSNGYRLAKQTYEMECRQ